MKSSRWTHALEAGALELPGEGPIGVFNAPAPLDTRALPSRNLVCIQRFRPTHDALAAAGLCMTTAAEAQLAAAIVVIPRSRDAARALVAEAMRATRPGGLVVVDGAKTDGIEALLRELREQVAPEGNIAKAHGRLFWFRNPAVMPSEMARWLDRERRAADGSVTAAGIFSADAPDRGSVALAEALPEKLGRHVVDLGAGWGYLAREILAARPGIERLDLVEADLDALDAARRNVTDPRARFHWADATTFRPDSAPDTVVTNPPFHESRRADPSLGRAFIDAAADMLSPSGNLWLVANRHLPYEGALARRFQRVEEVTVRDGFKILHAARPKAPAPGRARPLKRRKRHA